MGGSGSTTIASTDITPSGTRGHVRRSERKSKVEGLAAMFRVGFPERGDADATTNRRAARRGSATV